MSSETEQAIRIILWFYFVVLPFVGAIGMSFVAYSDFKMYRELKK